MSQEQKPQTVAESIINAKDDGTVPKDLKELIAQLFECVPDIVGFGQGVIQKMYMTEVYLHKKENEPRKWEAKTICEIVVTEGEWTCSILLRCFSKCVVNRYDQPRRDHAWWLFVVHYRQVRNYRVIRYVRASWNLSSQCYECCAVTTCRSYGQIPNTRLSEPQCSLPCTGNSVSLDCI